MRRWYKYLLSLGRLRFRGFQPLVPTSGPTLAAIERAQAFQRRVFGERVLQTPSAKLIEDSRRERDGQLP